MYIEYKTPTHPHIHRCIIPEGWNWTDQMNQSDQISNKNTL